MDSKNNIIEINSNLNLEEEKVLSNDLELIDEKLSMQAEKNSVDEAINGIAKDIEKNISEETKKQNLNLWEKFKQSGAKDVVNVAIESVLKNFLKKKFGINFSTFNKMKDTVEAVMGGDLKNALKKR